mgnify:CR=1 FL=1
MHASHASSSPRSAPPTPSIGERLAAARAQRGISYEDAAAATKLSVAYLHAMEANRFDHMPAPIYAKNFIRIYATYLGLDGRQLAEEFGRQTTMTVQLPAKVETSHMYHLSMLITQIVRHRVLLLVVACAVLALLLYLGSALDRGQAAPETPAGDPQLAKLLREYKPMFDLTEPLPPLD